MRTTPQQKLHCGWTLWNRSFEDEKLPEFNVELESVLKTFERQFLTKTLGNCADALVGLADERAFIDEDPRWAC
jgi:hypothetical protein